MIKLVVTDIDGTLLPEGTDQLNPELFDAIRALKKKGIAFAVASGRQYMSMRYLFAPVLDDVIFIAENGSNVMYQGKNLSSNFMKPEQAKAVVEYLRTLDGCTTVLSVPECMYVEQKNEEVIALLENGYHNEVRIVEDLMPLCDHTNKLCVYCNAGSAAYEEELLERFGTDLNTMVSGAKWVDFMNRSADKGNALREVQRMLGVAPEETMAFGDNCNDIGMLQCAGESYAVENAHPEVKKAVKYIAPANTEDGVLRTVKERLLKKASEEGENMIYKKEYLEAFLKNQTQLFDEPVAETLEEADAFLDDCMAVVADNLKEVKDYFEENGMDTAGLTKEELLEEAEVFALPDGKYLIVEG